MSYFLKQARWIKTESASKIAAAYFKAAKSDNLDSKTVTKTAPFGNGDYDKEVTTFMLGEKEYAVLGYNHFNGHFSSFADESAVYAIKVAEIY
jgi:hypothetical protein